jgi:hypothetical protein
LTATSFERTHRFDAASGTVKASILERYEALVLAERPAVPDGEVQAELLAKAWLDRGPLDEDVQLLRRLRFAGHAVVIGDLVLAAARLARALDDVKPARGLSPQVVGSLAHDAPDAITVPSGRRVPLEYDEHGAVSAAVKLQELFGLQHTPRVGVRHEPVLLALLAPNGRPVQLTRDLHSFWTSTYPEVRRELRGRYPRHPWPEDPRTAMPTGRVQPRRPGK